jgi:hypothetical protein
MEDKQISKNAVIKIIEGVIQDIKVGGGKVGGSWGGIIAGMIIVVLNVVLDEVKIKL